MKYTSNVSCGSCERCGVEYRSATARDAHEAWHFRRDQAEPMGCHMCWMGLFPGHLHLRSA